MNIQRQIARDAIARVLLQKKSQSTIAYGGRIPATRDDAQRLSRKLHEIFATDMIIVLSCSGCRRMTDVRRNDRGIESYSGMMSGLSLGNRATIAGSILRC
jgi:hypothetical protein